MELNDLQTVAAFVSEVGEDKYAMAKKKWLSRNYVRASAKLLIWMFNHVLTLEQRVSSLETALAPVQETAPENIEEDDKH